MGMSLPIQRQEDCEWACEVGWLTKQQQQRQERCWLDAGKEAEIVVGEVSEGRFGRRDEEGFSERRKRV